MFRRRSSSRHQPLNTTPSTSAQTAASRAYIANREANSNLSSAAAAAALRSHTPPPTSPGNVQTKRMLQRQLSNSSRGSTAGGLRHGSQPTLRRTPSSGSMTSRTFRDPSPGRSQSTSGATSRHHHPPVPPIPQHLPKSSTPSQRSVSVQPRRGTTSPLRTVSGRVASLDRGPSSMTASPTTPRNVSQGNSLELDRPPSRTSINFSYPMSARPNSPPQSPVDRESPRTSGEKSLTPPLLSPAESAGIQQSINSAANRKVKLKPKTAAPGSKEGSHFAHKTMGGRPTGTALQDEVENDEQDSHESASPQSPGVSTADFAPGHSVPVTEDRSPVAFEEDGITHIGRPKPKKRPSMVMEDHEGEELAEAAHAAQEAVAETPAVLKPTHPQTDNTSVKKPAREALVIYPPKSTQTAVSLHTRPSPSTSSTPSSPGERLMIDGNIDNQLPHRQSSTSPNRSARFSAQLTVGSESPLHEPPPRSVSPAKPALKNSSSPDRRIHLGQTPSEFSDATSVASDDGSRAGSKRRVAKVSFDDEAEVVGVAASPPTSPEPMNRAQSPVEKAKSRKWFGIGKKKTTSTDVAEDDDFESVLRPRPALPFFGSIRGMREPEEAAALSIDDNDSDSSSDDDFDSRDFGVSSDHAIGGILLNAHERANKTQQNPTNENLVPDFGSKDTQSEIPDEVETVKSTGGVNHLPTVQEEQRSTTSSEGTGTLPAQNTEVASKGETIIKQQVDGLKEPVPSIAIQPATPGAEPRNSIDLHNMPGGFPSYTSERVAAPEPSQQTPMKSPNPSNMPVQEPDSDGDDSGESIYSDAAEDPLDFQGDVFGSINAIVDSPLPPQAQLPKEAPESPTRTVVHPDPLTNLSEPVPSPSLEAINPRMPATPTGPTPAPSASSLKPVEEPQRRSPDPAESPWPLKTDATPSPAAHVQQESKAQSADPHQGSHLRKSLGKGDGEQQPLPNQSLRNTRPSSSAAAKPRRTQTASAAAHINDNPPRRQASKALPHSKTFPAAATMVSANDSDSDSSFKRTRRSSRIGAGSQYTMKRTMRATRPMSTANSDTLVERTTSPPRTSSMRTTMRGPAPERSSGFPSLRDKSGRPRPRSSVLPSNTRSRISDSDYEGRGGRRFFQSRFADSSDEDEPMPSNLTPVRGIPRRKDTYDGESTDLDDSSDEETQREVRNGRNKATVQMTPEELEAILSQPKKKGGLFSRLRPPTRDSGKDGKVRKSFIESPARRDTPLERSRPELARMREDVMSPKLQKRHRGTSAFADTWPLNTEQSSALAGSAAHNTQNRPSTSDGIANGLDKDNDRPLFSRHGTSESIDSRVTSTASEAAIGRSGKKKRFPLLRRAFGLRD